MSKQTTPYFTVAKAKRLIAMAIENKSDEQLNKVRVKLIDFDRYTHNTHFYQDILLRGGYFEQLASTSVSGLVPVDAWLPLNLRYKLELVLAEIERRKERGQQQQQENRPKSTCGDLLEYVGSWVGNDLEECLQSVYDNRTEAEFNS